MTDKPKKPHAPPPFDPHPLFEPEEPGAEAPIVYSIHVTRWDRDGKQRYFPTKFPAEQITDLTDIASAFGGGTYELIAYGPGGATARRRYSLDGRSKPLALATDADEEGGGPVATAPPVPIPTGGDGGNNALLLGVLQMMGQSQAAMFQATMGLVSAVMTSGRDAANQQIAQTQQTFAAMNQSQNALITAIMQSKNGGGGGNVLEMIREGMSIGQQMAVPTEGNEIDSVIEMVAPLVAGFTQGQAEQRSAPPPAPPGAES